VVGVATVLPSPGDRIGLVSCVKSKRDQPALACDLYTSPLFRKARAWAQSRCTRWYILSAKYGLVSPDEVIEPYELTLKVMSPSERVCWADRVRNQMEEAGLLQPCSSFIWLAGAAYKTDLSRLLSEFPQEDPMLGMAIGQRLKWLTRDLDGGA
jgi:hypothetical protein